MRATDAQAICNAIQAGERLVQVGVELFPGSDAVHPTTLVTAHVVALAEVQSESDEAPDGPNVHRLSDYHAL